MRGRWSAWWGQRRWIGLRLLPAAVLLLASCAPAAQEPEPEEDEPLPAPARVLVAQRASPSAPDPQVEPEPEPILALARLSVVPASVPAASPAASPGPISSPSPLPEPGLAPSPSPALTAALGVSPRPSAQVLLTPGPRPAVSTTLDLPILMYHRVQDLPPSNRDVQLRDLSVPPAAFAQHAAMVNSLGATAVTLEEVQDFFYGRVPPPPRAVAFTFDDGYADTFTQAYPVLRRLGFRATVFVVTDLMDQPGFMTWDQLRELAGAGWSIQSHSLSHPDLRTLSSAELQRQLRESRLRIEREVGRPAWYLAYPSGAYDRRVLDAVALAGYHAAVTVNYGTQVLLRQLFELPRVRVHGPDSAATVRAAMLPPSWR